MFLSYFFLNSISILFSILGGYMIYSYQPLVPTTTPRSGRCRGLRLGSRPTFRSDTYWETLPMPYPMSYLLPIQSASASTRHLPIVPDRVVSFPVLLQRSFQVQLRLSLPVLLCIFPGSVAKKHTLRFK